MKKLTTLKGAARQSLKEQKLGKKVGLVVGGFDILHMGHVNLFRYAKKHSDYVIVGLDNDNTIRLVKGKSRPINNISNRAEIICDLNTVDCVFEIETVAHHDSEAAIKCYENLLLSIKPTHIFIHKVCDNHWKSKHNLAKKYGIKFLFDESPKVTNSGKILKHILKEL